MELKSNIRTPAFFSTQLPQASPRGSYAITNPEIFQDLSKAIKRDRRRLRLELMFGIKQSNAPENKNSFPTPEIWNFSKGYDLIDIKKQEDMQSFYQEKGIHYVNGVIKRFKHENPLKYFKKLNHFYKEAKKFKENNPSQI